MAKAIGCLMSQTSAFAIDATARPALRTRILVRQAMPWLEGFGTRIAKVIGLALLLALATAAAPLAVMALVDTLARLATVQAASPGRTIAGAGRAIFFALALVAVAELLQVWLS